MAGVVKSLSRVEAAGTSLLTMSGISKSFSGVRVLEDVSFELRAGEVHILAGENGAGKSTLIKILAGVHADHGGEIRIDGRPVRIRTPQEAAAHGISAIHQELSLVESMSVRDNLFLGREITKAVRRLDFRAESARAAAILGELGIPAELGRAAGDYPIGVRQMIEIAKALLNEARILIMDEPTSALNDVEADRLFRLIGELKGRGCGIIYISHRLEEIYKLGDRISVLRDGRLAGLAEVSDLPPDRLVGWMVGRDLSRQFPARDPRPGDVVLEVRNLCLEGPSPAVRWAVEDVSFDLRAGEIAGVAGLQGSGKSDLLHGLFGSRGRPAAGSVRLAGDPWTVDSPARSIAGGLALLTSDRKGTGLVPVMSVAGNITLASIRGFSPGGWLRPGLEARAAEDSAASLAIKAWSMEQEVGTLSGGNQQKVVIAKWLRTSPRVLLLDEPTAGVDVGAKHDIYRLMNDLTDRGLAILLVASELEELLAMSDRILVLHRGRLTADLPRGRAGRETVMRAAMGEESP